MVTVRQLEAGEWELFRDLRLRSLADAPDAFRPTLAETAAIPDREWADLVRSTVEHPRGLLLAADDEHGAVGVLFARLGGGEGTSVYGGTPDDPATVDIGAMWVDPRVRGRGAGRALLEEAMAWGRRRGAERARLWVTDGNGPAVRLYRGAGFAPTGETGTLREGSDLAIVAMTCRL